ncbi:MAG: hypothetical protein ACE5GQ_07215 [Nitrospinales bacterium]
MYFYQYGGANPKMPFRVKAGLIAGAVVALLLLSVFAFAFFLAALSIGAALFIVNLFRGRAIRKQVELETFDLQSHRRPRPRASDDDVIDV